MYYISGRCARQAKAKVDPGDFAYRLIARDTVVEKILELQQTKRDLAAAMIGAENGMIETYALKTWQCCCPIDAISVCVLTSAGRRCHASVMRIVMNGDR